MSSQEQSRFKLNWSTARLIQSDPKLIALQKYCQERYGDKLTLATFRVQVKHRRELKKYGYIDFLRNVK